MRPARFTAEAGPYAGLNIFDANPQIVDDLRAQRRAVAREEYEHSYPHCWRCHNPVIFRATAQWFIAMDQNLLRQRAIDAIDACRVTARVGRGTPAADDRNAPRVVHLAPAHLGNADSRRSSAARAASRCSIRASRVSSRSVSREVGADAWWTEPVETFLPAAFRLPGLRGHRVRKGVEHRRYLVRIGGDASGGARPTTALTWPSDAVLEGGDQYRGWFRSSLITAVADQRPRTLPLRRQERLGERRAGPRDVEIVRYRHRCARSDGEVGRRRVASLDRLGGVRRRRAFRSRTSSSRSAASIATCVIEFASCSPTSRISTPATIVPPEAMEPLDRLACAVADAFAAEVRRSYRRFEIHDAYLQIVEFESAMSSLYFDALKDPLYSRAVERSAPAQRTVGAAVRSSRFLTALAPVLSFTAEEAWQALIPEAAWRAGQRFRHVF